MIFVAPCALKKRPALTTSFLCSGVPRAWARDVIYTQCGQGVCTNMPWSRLAKTPRKLKDVAGRASHARGA